MGLLGMVGDLTGFVDHRGGVGGRRKIGGCRF